MGTGDNQRTWARLRAVSKSFIATALSALICAGATGCSSSSSEDDYTRAYNLGLRAYTYGLPLLLTNKTFLSMTSINVSSGAYGPVNQFNNVRSLNNPGSTAVVAPGASSLSSIAWLDLTAEPQVLQVPPVPDHYYVLALVDPYTEDFQNLGNIQNTTPGHYVICGPGQHEVGIPEGTQRINVNYTRIWIIGSTQLKGQSDLYNVHQIQDGYQLVPLSKYGTHYKPAPPLHPNTHIKNYALPSGLEFFDVLGQQLAQFPPPAVDDDELNALAEVGIGPGQTPSQNAQLSAETLRGLTDAAAAGSGQIQIDAKEIALESGKIHNGYWLGGFGTYGTNYPLRAVVAQVGLGAVTSEQTIFAMNWTDSTMQPLVGSKNYVLHMTDAPPVNGGWSLTVYNLQGALVPNALKRYEFSSSSPLVYNADGSVDFYLQTAEPSDPNQQANWLPTPGEGAGFEVIMRLIGPKAEDIDPILNGDGWQPPKIVAVQ